MALSALVGLLVPTHVPIGEELSIDLPTDAAHWQVLARDMDVDFSQSVTLRSNAQALNQLDLVFDPPGTLQAMRQLRVRGQVTVSPEPFVSGATATLAVWFVDSLGQRLGYQNIHYLPDNSNTNVEAVLDWPPTAIQGVLGLFSQPGAAEFSVSKLQLDVVEANPWFRNCVTGLGFLWALWAARLVRLAVAVFPIGALVRPALFMLAILVGVSVSSRWVQHWLLPWLQWLAIQWGTTPNFVLTVAFKTGHASLFMLLCMALLSIRHVAGLRALDVVAFMVMLATSSEILQLIVPNRDPSVRDLLIDAMGIALGLILDIVVSQRLRRRVLRKRISSSGET